MNAKMEEVPSSATLAEQIERGLPMKLTMSPETQEMFKGTYDAEFVKTGDGIEVHFKIGGADAVIANAAAGRSAFPDEQRVVDYLMSRGFKIEVDTARLGAKSAQ